MMQEQGGAPAATGKPCPEKGARVWVVVYNDGPPRVLEKTFVRINRYDRWVLSGPFACTDWSPEAVYPTEAEAWAAIVDSLQEDLDEAKRRMVEVGGVSPDDQAAIDKRLAEQERAVWVSCTGCLLHQAPNHPAHGVPWGVGCAECNGRGIVLEPVWIGMRP